MWHTECLYLEEIIKITYKSRQENLRVMSTAILLCLPRMIFCYNFHLKAELLRQQQQQRGTWGFSVLELTGSVVELVRVGLNNEF